MSINPGLDIEYLVPLGNSNSVLEVNGMQKDPEKRSIPNTQANKLEQDLQRQFAELRRQNLAKIGFRPAPVTSEKGPKSVKTPVGIAREGATVKSKETEIGRKARLKRQKLSSAKKKPSPKSATRSSQDFSDDKENIGTAVKDEETEGKTSSAKAGTETEIDAHKRTADADLLKVYTDVQKSNKAAKVDDQTKGVGTESMNQNLTLPRKGVARSRSNGIRKVVQAAQALSSSKKDAVELTHTSKIRKRLSVRIRKHQSDSPDPDAMLKAVKTKSRTASSTGSPSPDSSTTRTPPSLNALPGTRSRKSADIKAVSAADLEIKGK